MKAKELIPLSKHLQELEKDGHDVAIRYEEKNTGITEDPNATDEVWKEYIDLGGREITITIQVGNKALEK